MKNLHLIPKRNKNLYRLKKNMTPTTKIITGIASVGVVGSGVGYAISSQFSTENISKKLTEAGYQILDEKEDAEWNLILTSYLATASNKDNLKFKDFTIATGEVAKLKQACQKALESPSTDNDSYKKAEHWCTVPRTVANLLDKKGYRALDTSEEDESKDREKWDTKLEDHASAKPEFKDKKFNSDSKIPITGSNVKNKTNRDAIKKQCDTLNKKKHYEIEFKADLEKSQIWCAIKENSQVSR